MSALRLYTFTNFYLSSIQQGIQSGHAAQELTNKYVFGNDVEFASQNRDQFSIFKDWSLNHKTYVCLNGGDYDGVDSILHLIEELDGLGYPFAAFFEDQRSLAGMLTSVAIVLPEEIYDAKNYNSVVRTSERQAVFPRDVYSEAWFWLYENGDIVHTYLPDSKEAQFLKVMKSCPLAR